MCTFRRYNSQGHSLDPVSCVGFRTQGVSRSEASQLRFSRSALEQPRLSQVCTLFGIAEVTQLKTAECHHSEETSSTSEGHSGLGSPDTRLLLQSERTQHRSHSSRALRLDRRRR